ASGIRAISKWIIQEMDKPETLSNSTNAATLMLRVRDAYDAVAEPMKMLSSLHDTLRQARGPEAFYADDVTSITINGRRLTRTSAFRARIRPDFKEEAYQWLRMNDLGELIIETVNSQSLSSAAKELSLENQELPQDWFETYLQPNISVTKAR